MTPGPGSSVGDDTGLTPVSVIGGYLGAGKTTLINQLLQGDHGLRLAVLVNDFGAINIDASLIAARDGNVVSMENGCVCCSIADALGDGLDEVLALTPPPDQILIEASGVADPAKIAAYGAGWPGCRLDAVVVLADAETIIDRSNDRFVGELVTRQLTRADMILLTKCDLVDPDRIERVQDWMAAKTTAPVVTIDGHLDDRHLDHALILDGRWLGPHDRDPARTNADDVTEAGRLFESISLSFEQPIQPGALAALEAAIDELPEDVIRLKGFLRLAPGDSPADPADCAELVAIQRVGTRTSIEPMAGRFDRSDSMGPGGVLVAIAPRGRMPEDALRSLTATLTPDGFEPAPR